MTKIGHGHVSSSPILTLHKALSPVNPTLQLVQEKMSSLNETHELLTILAGPQTIGWPVRRPRCFSAGLNRSTLVWTGPTAQKDLQHDFEQFYAATTRASGDVFLVAPREEVYEEQCRMASKRGRQMPALGGAADVPLLRREQVYAPGQLLRYADYNKIWSAKGGPFFADLEQSAVAGAATPGAELPCALTHWTIHSWSEDRPLVPMEAFLAHGFNTYPASTGLEKVCEVQACLQRLNVKEQKVLLGNGWHLPSICAWVFYLLSTQLVSQISQAFSLRRTFCSVAAQGLSRRRMMTLSMSLSPRSA